MIQVDVKNSFNGYARQYGLRKTSEIMLPHHTSTSYVSDSM